MYHPLINNQRIVHININHLSQFICRVTVDLLDSVYELKETLSKITRIPVNRIRLIFAGKLLSDDLTLFFYHLGENSTVFFTFQFQHYRLRPAVFINKLFNLCDELPNANSKRYSEIILEINQICRNPYLIAYSRINQDVQIILDEALNIVESTERPLSERTQRFIAQTRDTALDQLDNPEGIRILQALLDDDSDTEDIDEPLPSDLTTSTEISSAPLPNSWAPKPSIHKTHTHPIQVPKEPKKHQKSPRHPHQKTSKNKSCPNTAPRSQIGPILAPIIKPNISESCRVLYSNTQPPQKETKNNPSEDFDVKTTKNQPIFSEISKPTGSLALKSPRSPRTNSRAENNKENELKTKFSKQVRDLMQMGFKDENIIIQALNETNGNVQLAARLLQNHFAL